MALLNLNAIFDQIEKETGVRPTMNALPPDLQAKLSELSSGMNEMVHGMADAIFDQFGKPGEEGTVIEAEPAPSAADEPITAVTAETADPVAQDAEASPGGAPSPDVNAAIIAEIQKMAERQRLEAETMQRIQQVEHDQMIHAIEGISDAGGSHDDGVIAAQTEADVDAAEPALASSEVANEGDDTTA